MLKLRILTAAILMPLAIIAILYLPTSWTVCLSALLMIITTKEWGNLCKLNNTASIYYICFVIFTSAAIMQIPISIYELCQYSLTIWAILIAAVIYYPRSNNLVSLTIFKLIAGPFIIVPTFAAIIALQQIQPYGNWLLLSCGLIWAADSGAYFIGRSFGKKLLHPNVSPGKSWEGVLGGICCCWLVATIIYASKSLHIGLIEILIFSSVIAITSVLGDLIESMFKRSSGIKDSGKILPGHGGILDRIDGMLLSLPVAMVILKFLI